MKHYLSISARPNQKTYLCIGLTLVDIDFNQNRLNLAKEVEEWDTNTLTILLNENY